MLGHLVRKEILDHISGLRFFVLANSFLAVRLAEGIIMASVGNTKRQSAQPRAGRLPNFSAGKLSYLIRISFASPRTAPIINM